MFDIPFRFHFTTNGILNFLQFLVLILYQKLPTWFPTLFLDETVKRNEVIYKLYPLIYYGSMTSCILGNIIMIMNRFIGIMKPLYYRNKWNKSVSIVIITIQISVSFLLYFHTLFASVDLIHDEDMDRYIFDISSHGSLIASNTTLALIVFLSTFISVTANVKIWLKFKKFFESKNKGTDIVQKFSYFIYSVILTFALLVFSIQQAIRFESIFSNNQKKRNFFSLWFFYILPFLSTFQPYYIILCSKSIRDDMIVYWKKHFFSVNSNNCKTSSCLGSKEVNRTVPNKTWIGE
uniref:Serpentine receptor class gamma n=1 Tax=Parastrongyloides trichosuri TaxID=131310 RepID=A0A0N4ZVW8_PARTI